MKHIMFRDEFSFESFDDLLESINETEDDILLYLVSGGGCAVTGNLITNLINTEDRIKKVIFMWECSSSAFRVLMNCDKPKELMSVYSVLHLGTKTTDTRSLLKNGNHQKFFMSDIGKFNKDYIEWLKHIGVSKKIRKKIKQGKDIYLTQEQIEELIGIKATKDYMSIGSGTDVTTIAPQGIETLRRK